LASEEGREASGMDENNSIGGMRICDEDHLFIKLYESISVGLYTYFTCYLNHVPMLIK